MRFTASYDLATRIVSAVLCAALLVMAAVVSRTTPLAILAIVVPVLVTYAYSPRGYEVEGRSIWVRRLIGRVEVPLEDIRELRPGTPADLKGAVRLWASGGLFGYFGVFRSAALGKSTWYLTNRANTVVLVTASRTVLFSPDDVAGFLGAIRASAPVPEGGPAAGLPAPRAEGSKARLAGPLAGVVIGVAAVALVVAALLYSPGLPTYTLTGSALTINDRFYPVTVSASSVDVTGIRVVNLAADSEWWPAARTNGFANSHYQSGWFRTAQGVRMRLYRANGDTRLVLLPGTGEAAPVLLDVADPAAFAAEVRARWSR